MQRSQKFGLAALLAGAAAVITTLLLIKGYGSSGAPAPGLVAPAEEVPAVAVSGHTAAVGATSRREVIAESGNSRTTETDPDVRAALAGFRGRVVDHNKAPVADCGVQLFRFAIDSLLSEDVDLFGDQLNYAPEVEAGDAVTKQDGTFLIEGVWPQAIFMLHAGIGTDAPTHRMLPDTPTPGEIFDLGDIVLNHAAVLSGRVVDEDGMPVAGAVVRAIDLPGQVLGFVPVERFDPGGCVLVRESGSPIQVVEMPPWLPDFFDQLPIPKTESDDDGNFRLVGVVAGNNAVAVTREGFLSHIKPAVRVAAGEEKTLGEIQLDAGEELYGQVVDSEGEPVVGAQVVAGSTLALVPADFVSHVGPSDDKGNFYAEGFGPGKVTVAARRSDKDPWVVAEPQPVLRDVVITLPSVASLTVRIKGIGGAEVRDPKVRLLSGTDQKAAVVLSIYGVSRAIEIEDRTNRLEDGSLRIDDLPLGPYVLMASAKGARLTTAEVEVQAADNVVELQLEPSMEHLVRVLGPEDKPVRSAKVFVQERDREVRDMPWCAGRTDGEGRLLVDSAGTKRIRVSASHPRWGTVHGESQVGNGELVLRMQEPGWIEGVLTDLGRAPEPAKYTLSAEWRPETRGVGGVTPVLATPGLDGSFEMRAVQPGTYRVEVMPGLQSLASPGGLYGLIGSLEMGPRMPRETVQVVSGEGVEVRLNIGGGEDLGPSGSVFGSVMVDGQLAEGYLISGRSGRHRATRQVDAAGRFDLGKMPTGRVRIYLRRGGGGGMFERNPLWQGSFEIGLAEQKEVTIDVKTTSLSGFVVRPNGGPAAGMFVRMDGKLLGGASGSEVSSITTTDANGAFSFDQIAEGVFNLEAEGGEGDLVRVRLKEVRATNAAPVTGLRLQLKSTIPVSGRIDPRVVGEPPEWGWLSFRREDPKHPGDRSKASRVGSEVLGAKMEFETRDLEPGTYFVSLRLYDDDNGQREFYVIKPLVVPPQGLSGIVLMPVLRTNNK